MFTKDSPEVIAWLTACQRMLDAYMVLNFPTLALPVLTMQQGKRYIRIVKGGNNSRSAWAFIDMDNGDILKPAGWKAPASIARGNLCDSTKGLSKMTPYGPAYLR